MCLYPNLIKNRKYTANKKNGGHVPPVSDMRTLYVPVGCGKCIECTKQKARSWQVRLSEDLKEFKNGKFITLTFSNEKLRELAAELPAIEGYELDNEIATLATRRFLERWRKEHKKSVRHWFVTELGHNGTENIHIHGIIWTDHLKPYFDKELNKKITTNDQLRAIWQYGFTWTGEYVNERTVSYITKYITKIDLLHKEYKPRVLTSNGIGRRYTTSTNADNNKYKPNDTKEYYRTNTGHKIALPTYYRNKLYTDEEKEKLWLQKLNNETRYVCGEKAENYKQYWALLKHYRKKNTRLGYGNDEINWQQKEYEKQIRIIKQRQRLDIPEEVKRDRYAKAPEVLNYAEYWKSQGVISASPAGASGGTRWTVQ